MKNLTYILLLMPLFMMGQLQSSGPISLGDIRTERGVTGPYSIGDGRTDFSLSGATSLADFYGLSYGGGSCVLMTGLKYNQFSSDCNTHTPILGRYGSDAALNNTSGLYTDSNCTVKAASGWYSDSNGTIVRYWDQTLGQFTQSELCGF